MSKKIHDENLENINGGAGGALSDALKKVLGLDGNEAAPDLVTGAAPKASVNQLADSSNGKSDAKGKTSKFYFGVRI